MMWRLSLFSLCLILFLCTSVTAIGDHRASRILSSFTFKPPFFPDAGLAAVPGWEVRGAEITPDFIRLTSNDPQRRGAIINKRPFFLKSVELTLEFKIHSSLQHGSDGMAVWLMDQPVRSGPAYGGPDTWTGVAIVLDSVNEDGQTKLKIHYNDGTARFSNNEKDTLLASCAATYRNPPERSYLHVYVENDQVNVFIDAQGDDNWERCSPPIPVKMPNRYFFGITAATNRDQQQSDYHDVFSFRVNTMDEKLTLSDDDMNKPSKDDHAEPPKTKEEPLETTETKTDNEDPAKDNATKNSQKEQKINNNPSKSEEVVNKEVQQIIKELEEQIAHLEKEKDLQKKAADEAQRILAVKKADEDQKAKDWEIKQQQLQEAQKFAQQLIIEKEKEQSKQLAKYSQCDELKTECTNLRISYKVLDNSADRIKESFGHELVEIQYLFNSKLREIGTLVNPITQHTSSIGQDTVQAQSQLSQLSRIIEQLQSLVTKSVATGEAQDSNKKGKFREAIDSLTTLHKSLVQIQVEQRKLQELQLHLRDKVKQSQSSGGLEFFVALLLFTQLVFQGIQFLRRRKQNPRSPFNF